MINPEFKMHLNRISNFLQWLYLKASGANKIQNNDYINWVLNYCNWTPIEACKK
jgi:hypothetical protein